MHGLYWQQLVPIAHWLVEGAEQPECEPEGQVPASPTEKQVSAAPPQQGITQYCPVPQVAVPQVMAPSPPLLIVAPPVVALPPSALPPPLEPPEPLEPASALPPVLALLSLIEPLQAASSKHGRSDKTKRRTMGSCTGHFTAMHMPPLTPAESRHFEAFVPVSVPIRVRKCAFGGAPEPR